MTAHTSRHTRQARAPREGGLETQNQSPFQRNQRIGVSRGDRSAKIHAVVDALGNPAHALSSTGNTSDITVAEELLNQVSIGGSTVLADKAYGKWAFREVLADHNADLGIPPKKNETDPWLCDWRLYKERRLVEPCFLKLKEFRRAATRFDKLARRFLGFVHLECIRHFVGLIQALCIWKHTLA